MTISKRAAWFGIVVLLAFIIGFLVSFARADVHNRVNATGAVIEYSNPNSYLYGSVIDGNMLHDEHGAYTNVRFSPFHTFALYDETILFCGDQAAKFFEGPMVVTYRTRASRMHEGVACHDLISVNRVEDEVQQ